MTVPLVSDYDDGPVSPELVLVDPALRARLAMRESVLPGEPLHAAAEVAASTSVPEVLIVAGDDGSVVHPEPVPIDHVGRADHAGRESVLPDIEPLHAETALLPSTNLQEVPIASDSDSDDSPVGLEPVPVDPALRVHLPGQVPRRSAARRLLVMVATAAALSAAAASGVFVGLLLSGDRAAVLGDAAATPPPPPSPRQAAAKPTSPAVSTQPPSSQAGTSAAPQAGVSGAASSRLLVWAPVANASGYAVEITRNGESFFSATTSVPHVRVPGQWRHAGRNVTLSPGTYHWYVWPVIRSGTTTRRSPAAVVASNLEVAP